MAEKLHPSVEEFKLFVKEHPELVKAVRSGEGTWQEFYEEWYLLGPDDPKWSNYKLNQSTESKSTHSNDTTEESSGNSNWINQITGVLKKMDPNQLQYHIGQLSEAIGAIQGVMGQFQSENKQNTSQSQGARHPFAFRKD